ncbi:MAG: UDP-3-O-(3-hydroxymyristoyl)glucosamine N-acyltransferase [Oceanicaulis sp.]|nr:UDP-3-O-(3-hydroxymyristoyl)glucosamine N-acyltransferase [Oceanicaulis sp.]
MGADPRFYERLGPLTASELAGRLGARLEGDAGLSVEDVSEPSGAGPGDLIFLTKAPGEPLDVSGACVIAPSAALAQLSSAGAVLVHEAPRAAFARAADALLAVRVHDGAAPVSPHAQIAPSAQIGPGAVIGQHAEIGEGAHIGPGAVIGPGVVIGPGSRIGARAVIMCAMLGRDCEISSGAVIGEAGFGLAYEAGDIVALPHLGRVLIGDAVSVGANSTIDRGMLRDTVLGRSCRIDNLCHIAHNVEMGAHAVMAAFAGVSGSVVIGDGAQFGGRVGIADHLTIGARARLAADAAVMRDVPAGETWAGSPAQPLKSFMRETAWLRRESTRKPRRDKPEGTS